MKFLIILSVLVAGIWLWRSNRDARPQAKKQQKQARKPTPLEMIGCSLCAVHVPLVDAVKGKKGIYCCAEHRHRAES